MSHDLGPFIGLVAVVMLFGIPIVAVVSHYVHEMLKTWMLTGLKRDMVARGYTAQEIVEVISAERGTKTSAFLPNVPPAKPVKQPVYS
jgi:hypothetical protein